MLNKNLGIKIKQGNGNMNLYSASPEEIIEYLGEEIVELILIRLFVDTHLDCEKFRRPLYKKKFVKSLRTKLYVTTYGLHSSSSRYEIYFKNGHGSFLCVYIQKDLVPRFVELLNKGESND